MQRLPRWPTAARAAFLLLVVLLLAQLAASAATNRPNILLLLADDWAWPHASSLGCADLQTPTFDRLAREGVLFRHAHVAAPSCSPSRAAMLTGQWPWRLGEAANLHAAIPPRFAVYPDLLANAGYFVGRTGKGYGPGADTGRPHNAAGAGFPNFAAFMAQRPAGQPFCFWLGAHQPHRPYQADAGLAAGHHPAAVTVPPYLPDTEMVRRDICDYYHEVEVFDHLAGAAVAELERRGELDRTLIVITGDNGWPFPRSKATCYDTGTHQPLAVRWGDRVPGGRVVEDFVSLADLAPTFLAAAGLTPPAEMTARSFLEVLLGGRAGWVDPARGHLLTGMERHTSHGRTDGDQTGVGYPMRTLLTRDFHYLRNFRPGRWPAGNPPSAGRTPDFAAFAANTYAGFADVDAGRAKAWVATHPDDPAFARAFGLRPARELYDLRTDPFEMHNVAADPAYAAQVADLDRRLMAELAATGDPRATPGADADAFDHYPARGPAAK